MPKIINTDKNQFGDTGNDIYYWELECRILWHDSIPLPGSVIVALILMLFIEFKDRGVLFGYPTPKQLKDKQDSVWLSPVYLVRKYHGYFIYWAAIFTFWYHPMENTLGHAFGFTHTWFMMLQGMLATVISTVAKGRQLSCKCLF